MRFARILGGVASMLLMLSLLAGVPTGLFLLVGNPLPTSVPDWSAVASSLERADVPTSVMVNVLALIVWIWWLQVVAGTVAEGLASLRAGTAQRLLRMLGRLRRIWGGRRIAGEQVVRSPQQADETEQEPPTEPAREQLGLVGGALAKLDECLDGHDPPPIVGLSHTPQTVTVLLEERVAAPAPFVTVDDGFAWEIGEAAVEGAGGRPWKGRAPEILITAGWHERSGSEVLLNLEHIGHLGIGGAEDDVLPILDTMAAELSRSPFTDRVEIVCVGFGSSLADIKGLRVVSKLSDLLGEMETGAGRDGQLELAVVFDPYTEDRDVLARLERAIGHGLVAVTANGESQWKLMCRSGTVTLWPVDLTLERRDLDADSIGDLEPMVEAPPPDLEPVLREVQLPEPDVEICVLGAIRVLGVDEQFSSRVALALVAYLAFHRDGATADELKRWLWHPDSPPSDKLFANTISRARTTLGADSSDEPHLPRVGGDRIYRLGDSVGTDVDRFRTLLDLADKEPAVSRQLLRQALELVRGLVFAGGDDQPFAWVDHTIRSHIEFLVDETAHRLADEALRVGDAEEARWAALVGLKLIPDCESCFRRRFLAADLAGNRTELKRAMAELRRLVAVDSSIPDASDLISPELEELYADLLAGRAVAV